MFKFHFKAIAFLVLLLSFSAAAQTDPNPDSPVPVLLSYGNSDRVLAVADDRWLGGVPTAGEEVFRPGPKSFITLFVTNVELLPKESANAFRVYLYQKNNKIFELETVDLFDIDGSVYGLKVKLADRNGYRGQPLSNGDSVIYLTWRGLVSNALKISLGPRGEPIEIPAFLKTAPPKQIETKTDDYAGYQWSGDRIRFLEQATFGPTTALDSRIRRIGLRIWLAEQFETPYPTIPYPDIPLMPTTPPDGCSQTTNPTCYRERYTMQPVQQWLFKEAFYGEAQLRHRVAWALSQIWVTSGVTVQQSSHMIAYHKVLSENAFGNYRDLMKRMTLNPTMGHYLDMARSTKANPNENYAREILQLFTIGLFMLDPDGTPQRDANNQPIPTYDQETIINLAKVFTGWSFCQTASCPNAVPGRVNYKDPMILTPANHDLTEKYLLDYPNAVNRVIPACENCTDPQQIAAYANDSLDKALDNIFYHPSLPPHISRLLIQHLVTSDPSPAYVQRVAEVFADNGSGVRGDMKAVIRAILLDPEARGNIKTAPRYGKLREPVQLITNLGRLFPARSADGQGPSDGGFNYWTGRMGQNPFNSPTVFNYYPPDYVVPGTTLNAPEFALLNTTTGINRTNFLHVLIFERILPNVTDSLRGTSLELSEAESFAAADPTGNQLLDYLNRRMLHGAMSAEHRSAVLEAVLAVPSNNPLLRAKTAIYLIAASSQYQIQR
jgi:uncharacterized protein (DUF1800 family)